MMEKAEEAAEVPVQEIADVHSLVRFSAVEAQGAAAVPLGAALLDVAPLVVVVAVEEADAEGVVAKNQ